MILVSGFNVYPNENEEAMTQHHAVLEVRCYRRSSDNRGEDPKDFCGEKSLIVNVTEQELLDFGKSN